MKPHVNRHQNGAASLIVVLLLFFLMMLVTAYASRSLIFEQRTSANQYRATQASEAAEAGLQWTLAMLNGGRIDADCAPSIQSTDKSFRDRYMTSDASGKLLPVLVSVPVVAACVRLAEVWSCSCPATGNPNLDNRLVNPDPPLIRPAPSFGVQLLPIGQPGFMGVRVLGCAGVDSRCQVDASLRDSDAFAAHSILVTPRGLANSPIAALTAGGAIDIASAGMQIVNRDPAATGVAAHARGAITAPAGVLVGPPGTPDPQIADDPSLESDDRLFTTFFGLSKATYQQLPGLRPCASGSCSTTTLTAAVEAGRRMFWAGDAVTLAAGTIGSPTEPVLLVVNDTLTLQGDVRIYGLVYARELVWTGSGGLVQGATMVQGPCCGGAGAPSLVYDAAILQRLTLQTGALLRVPGSWLDK